MKRILSWAPPFIARYISDYKEKGFKGFIKTHGWKVVVVFFMFYLIRDGILYILIPYLLINNIIQCQ